MTIVTIDNWINRLIFAALDPEINAGNHPHLNPSLPLPLHSLLSLL